MLAPAVDHTNTAANQSADRLCDLDWVQRASPPEIELPLKGSISLADLFCGCGGLTLGVAEAARSAGYGLKIKLAVDNFDSALGVYRANFGVGESVAVNEDIGALLPGDLGTPSSSVERDLRAQLGQLDLIVAGPPCQGHSDLNNSSRRNDERNKLYLKVARFSEIVRPNAILIENVPAVVHDKNDVVESVRRSLSEQGYFVDEALLDLRSFGIPQTRRRHILLANRSQPIDLSEVLGRSDSDMPLSRFIEDLQDEPDTSTELYRTPSRMLEANRSRVQHLFEHDIYDLPNNLRPVCHQNNSHSYKSMYGRLHWDRPAQTLTSGFGSMGQGRFVHPTRRRVLTPHEAARIQGFPDFFSFESVKYRTHLHEMIGNAVPPQLSAHLTNLLIKRAVA